MKKMKILLVEDNPDDEFLTLRLLSKMSLDDVDVVHQGGEALDYLFGNADIYKTAPVINKPDLILLDMKMPLVDGIEFLEAAHTNLRTNEIPVIIISSSKQEKDVNRCIELGAKAYLTKPIDHTELERVIVSKC